MDPDCSEFQSHSVQFFGYVSHDINGRTGAQYKISRGTRILGWLQSINAHAEGKGLEIRRNWDSTEIQEPHNGGNGQWEIAKKRGSTSVRSLPWSLRDHLESSAKNTDATMSGPAVKKPRLTKQGKKILARRKISYVFVVLGLSSNSGTSSSSTSPPQDSSSTSSSPTPERSDKPAPGNGRAIPQKPKTKIKKGWRLRGFQESLDKITKASWRRRTGEALPRAEKFADLNTADHKVLKEECESRDNHRYAVAVQDRATLWIQSYPCKTKTSQKTDEVWRKCLGAGRKAESKLHRQRIGI